jgi:hypothetical protein
MAFQRKGWANLSPKYRKELARFGIDQSRYQAGASRRQWLSFERRQEAYYGRDTSEIREELREHDPATVIDAINAQKRMEEYFHAGRMEEARRLWDQRDTSLPEWMFYYHGMFS